MPFIWMKFPFSIFNPRGCYGVLINPLTWQDQANYHVYPDWAAMQVTHSALTFFPAFIKYS